MEVDKIGDIYMYDDPTTKLLSQVFGKRWMRQTLRDNKMHKAQTKRAEHIVGLRLENVPAELKYRVKKKLLGASRKKAKQIRLRVFLNLALRMWGTQECPKGAQFKMFATLLNEHRADVEKKEAQMEAVRFLSRYYKGDI